MVDITNGFSTMTVTKGAFEGIYKHQGYILVHDYAGSVQVKSDKDVKAKDNNSIIEPKEVASVNLEETAKVDNSDETAEAEKSEILEKPIGQWNQEELKAYAAENGISLEGVSSIKEARRIVKNYIDSLAD